MNSDHPNSPALASMPMEREPGGARDCGREPGRAEPVEQELYERNIGAYLAYDLVLYIISLLSPHPLRATCSTILSLPQASQRELVERAYDGILWSGALERIREQEPYGGNIRDPKTEPECGAMGASLISKVVCPVKREPVIRSLGRAYGAGACGAGK
ncbi:hypothetical protein Tco_0261525 [Tanacetum coccineum]